MTELKSRNIEWRLFAYEHLLERKPSVEYVHRLGPGTKNGVFAITSREQNYGNISTMLLCLRPNEILRLCISWDQCIVNFSSSWLSLVLVFALIN